MTLIERAKAQSSAVGLPEPESDVTDELRKRAASLEDLFARETFFKELPSIEQTRSYRD